MIHTPARTRLAPNKDESGNVSPPNNHPSITAPGGVMSEMLCSCATVRRGSNQERSTNVKHDPTTATPPQKASGPLNPSNLPQIIATPPSAIIAPASLCKRSGSSGSIQCAKIMPNIGIVACNTAASPEDT